MTLEERMRLETVCRVYRGEDAGDVEAIRRQCRQEMADLARMILGRATAPSDDRTRN